MLLLSKIGVRSEQFLKLKDNFPSCVSCQFGEPHRHPWCTKGSASGSLSILRGPAPLEPGEMVAGDQLISAQPDLVPKECGVVTWARILVATVFVDYATRYIHLALMRDQTNQATLEAKEAFEHFSSTCNVCPRHYRASKTQPRLLGKK